METLKDSELLNSVMGGVVSNPRTNDTELNTITVTPNGPPRPRDDGRDA